MKVSVGISNRHVHLTNDDLNILFGEELTIRNNLNQPLQFASNQVVSVIGPKGNISGLRVLGPTRNYTQVEISRTDSFKLGVNPPVRDSGQLDGAELLTIVGPKGSIERNCCIIATRHIHVNDQIRKEHGLDEINEVKIQISNQKGGIIDHVYLKDSDLSYFELHLDTDDANAFLLKNNDQVEIIK